MTTQTKLITRCYFYFVVETAATDLDMLTDGTDKFVGGLYTGVNNAAGKTFNVDN